MNHGIHKGFKFFGRRNAQRYFLCRDYLEAHQGIRIHGSNIEGEGEHLFYGGNVFVDCGIRNLALTPFSVFMQMPSIEFLDRDASELLVDRLK